MPVAGPTASARAGCSSPAWPPSSTEVLALAPTGEQGRAAAAQTLAISLGVAIPTGLGGAVVALRGEAITGADFAALMPVAAVVAAVGALLARRIGVGRDPGGAGVSRAR